MLAGVIDPACQGEIGLLLYYRGKEDYVWNTKNLLGCFLAWLCPVIEVNRKLQQSNSGKTTNIPDFLRMKVGVTPPGKKHK